MTVSIPLFLVGVFLLSAASFICGSWCRDVARKDTAALLYRALLVAQHEHLSRQAEAVVEDALEQYEGLFRL